MSSLCRNVGASRMPVAHLAGDPRWPLEGQHCHCARRFFDLVFLVNLPVCLGCSFYPFYCCHPTAGTSTMGGCFKLNFIERRLSLFFDVYSRFVSRHPWPFIVFPLLLNIALSVGLLYMHEITDATYLYTPTRALSKIEREVIHQKWPLVDGNYVAGHSITALRECQSIVSAKDGGNILRAEYAESVNRLNLFIINRIKVQYRNRTYGYMDLCLHWENTCFTNPQLGVISTAYQSRERNAFNLTYPITRLGSQPIYLGSSLGGVRLDQHGHIESAEAWLLVYQLQFYPDNNSYVSGLWEKEFQRALLSYRDPLLDISALHSQTLDDELERNADHLTPRFALCFLILLVFATLCTLRFIDGTGYIDWTVSKPILALVGVIGAGIGVSSAVGLMNLCGMIYTQIVAVMPFLIVSVRLDNTFLMISAVRRTSPQKTVEDRIGDAMSEAAVSITITVLTDVFSFALGILTNIPAVQIFCAYTTAAIATTFFNQLTIMMAVLALTLRMEQKGVNCVLICMKTHTYRENEGKSQGIFTRLFNLGTSVSTLPAKDGSLEPAGRDFAQKVFEDWYAPVLMHPVMRFVVVVWFILYLALSIWFCTNLREGLEPVNLLVSDSYAIPHYRALGKYFWNYGTEVQVVVNNPPDVSEEAGRFKATELVRAFASSPYGMGMDGVMFWLFEFERFLVELKLPHLAFMSKKDFYDSLRHFLELGAFERFRFDILWEENPKNPDDGRIGAYRFYMGIQNFTNSVQQTMAVQSLRAIAAHFSQYNVTTFHPLWLFVDQYQEILPNVIQEVVAGISVMVLIALLMIPHPCCSFWVAVTIASIDLGVVGLMTEWGINLDTVSMITIIMSIGFSVDFSAHIAHAFVVSDLKSSTERAKRAISRMAWPVIQGGVSTILGVAVLANLDSYMILAFFKTVLLVIVLGMLHAIVFLPVLLSLFVHRPSSGSHMRPVRSSTLKTCNGAISSQLSPTVMTSVPQMMLSSRLEHEYETIKKYVATRHPTLYVPASLGYAHPIVENGRTDCDPADMPSAGNFIPDAHAQQEYSVFRPSDYAHWNGRPIAPELHCRMNFPDMMPFDVRYKETR
uniref:SSD domain-containing protein n=1 Tax=Trichuris muris TaxID=70415 RepID=A0A5S6Q2L8_TRIMR